MKLKKRVLIPLCVLVAGIAALMYNGSFSRAEKGNVIGHLQTRDKIVTILRSEKGTVYTVKTKDGKILAENLSEQSLETKYPTVFRQMKNGLAGNDATLYKTAVPLNIDEVTVPPDK
jgi:hypothetical protein